MTDFDRTTLTSSERDDLARRRQPVFVPLDVTAFVVAALMIWGPLAAGALHS